MTFADDAMQVEHRRVLANLRFEAEQLKLQSELEKLQGQHRRPNSSDRAALVTPQTQA